MEAVACRVGVWYRAADTSSAVGGGDVEVNDKMRAPGTALAWDGMAVGRRHTVRVKELEACGDSVVVLIYGRQIVEKKTAVC